MAKKKTRRRSTGFSLTNIIPVALVGGALLSLLRPSEATAPGIPAPPPVVPPPVVPPPVVPPPVVPPPVVPPPDIPPIPPPGGDLPSGFIYPDMLTTILEILDRFGTINYWVPEVSLTFSLQDIASRRGRAISSRVLDRITLANIVWLKVKADSF